MKRRRYLNRETKEGFRLFHLFLFIIIVTILMVFYVWEKVEMGILLHEIDELKKQEAQLKEENDKLRAKVTQLSSYGRITSLAQDKLGMVFPPQEMVYLPEKWKDLPSDEFKRKESFP
jgi:cell division protein FtsL